MNAILRREKWRIELSEAKKDQIEDITTVNFAMKEFICAPVPVFGSASNVKRLIRCQH